MDPTPNYLLVVADYIHLNPARIKGYDFENAKLADYVWSSYPGYVSSRKRSAWLCVQRVLGELGLADTRSGRLRFARYMRERIEGIREAEKPWEADERWKTIRRGWHLGGEEFKSEMLERLSGLLACDKGTPFGGEALQAHDEHRAEALLKAGMVSLKLEERDLSAMPGCRPEKYALAWLVRRKTSVKVQWIKKRLHLGKATDFSAWLKKLEFSRPGEWGHESYARIRLIN